MGWLSNLMSGSGDSIAKPVDAIGNALDKVFTSDDEKLTHAEVMEKLIQQPAIAQQVLNELNAKSESVFIAGGRPAIIWICAASLAIYYIPQFSVATYMWTKFSFAAGAIQPYPIDSGQLMQLVWAVLGLGAYRTVDKTVDKVISKK